MESSFNAPVVPASASRSGDERDRLFRLSLDLLCIAGLDGRFKQVNPSWTRVLGWSEEDLLSHLVVDFMHPDDRERTLAARAGLAKGIPVRGLENRYSLGRLPSSPARRRFSPLRATSPSAGVWTKKI
jgi:PAS domain-containing protein